jgi:hypothetical protein
VRILALALLVLICAGCHRSGTWTDSPKNWERAFGQKPPKDLKIVHSQYWRSPHFTLEMEYFFEFAASETFRKEFTAYPKLQKFEPKTKEEEDAILRFFHEKPSWFVPRSLDHYEIWRGDPKDMNWDNFRLFIDRETGAMFFGDYSV